MNSNGLSPTSSCPEEAADPTLRQRRDAMYTPLEAAIEELHNRRRRFAGRTPGRDWLPDDLPEHSGGYAFTSRYVATPNFETQRFMGNTNGTGLLPVIAGLSRDKFVTHNPLKRALARMCFHHGFNRHGQTLVEYMNVLDDKQQGRPLGEVRTFWGQSLVAFHQELLTHALNGDSHPVIFDNSPQYARAGCCPTAYYREFLLRLCLADGILFEDFLLDETEIAFTRDVVLPAFEAVTGQFGMRPLIVYMTSPKELNLPHWYWYPGELKEFVNNRLKEVCA